MTKAVCLLWLLCCSRCAAAVRPAPRGAAAAPHVGFPVAGGSASQRHTVRQTRAVCPAGVRNSAGHHKSTPTS